MKARIIVNEKCHRNCELCANKFPRVRGAFEDTMDWGCLYACSEVCISGGEPLLDWYRVQTLLDRLKSFSVPEQKLWLYTSIYRRELELLMPYLDGVHFTVHGGQPPDIQREDVKDLRRIEALLPRFPGRHNRLKIQINGGVLPQFSINPKVWDVIRLRPFMNEEQLFSRPDSLMVLGHEGSERLFLLEE